MRCYTKGNVRPSRYDRVLKFIIISWGTGLPYGLHTRRMGNNPPCGPSADWCVLTTANTAEINDSTCRPKYRAQDIKFLVTHQMIDLCECCLTSANSRRAHWPRGHLAFPFKLYITARDRPATARHAVHLQFATIALKIRAVQTPKTAVQSSKCLMCLMCCWLYLFKKIRVEKRTQYHAS
jgi:hypothetical protein